MCQMVVMVGRFTVLVVMAMMTVPVIASADNDNVEFPTTYGYVMVGPSPAYEWVWPGYGEIARQAVIDGLASWETATDGMMLFEDVTAEAEACESTYGMHGYGWNYCMEEITDFALYLGGTGLYRTVEYGEATGQTYEGCLSWGDDRPTCVIDIYVEKYLPFDRNYQYLMDGDNIRQAVAHEIGHILGLPHHDDPEHVMWSGVNARNYDAETEYGVRAPPNVNATGYTIQYEAYGSLFTPAFDIPVYRLPVATYLTDDNRLIECRDMTLDWE